MLDGKMLLWPQQFHITDCNNIFSKVWWLFFIGFPFSYHLKFKICSNCDASLSKNDEYARYLEMEMKTLTFHTFVVRKKSWQWVQRSNQHYLTLNERRCWVSMNRPVVRTVLNSRVKVILSLQMWDNANEVVQTGLKKTWKCAQNEKTHPLAFLCAIVITSK